MRAALAALPGVRHVDVDFEKRQAIVIVEEAAYSEQKLIRVLQEAGFGGSARKTISTTHEAAGQETAKPQPGIAPEETRIDVPQTAYSRPLFAKHLQVSAHLDRDVLRPGDAFRVAVVLNIEKGWHIYGNPLGPGIGQATVISAESPEGFHFDPARYVPGHKGEQDFGEAGKTWVWEHTGKVVHYLPGKVSRDAEPGTYRWSVRVSSQVCDPKNCIPGEATVPLEVTVLATDSPSQPANQDLFAGFAEAKVPPD